MNKKLVLIFSLFCLPSALSAKGSGGQPGAFLSWGAGARSLAMGKAYVSVVDDASATYWNPAGLSLLDRKEIMALHASLWAGTLYDFISYVHPTPKNGVFGVNLVRLNTPGFEKISVSISPDGNVTLDKLGDFSDSQTALTFAYGKKVLDKISLGISGKFINHTLDTSSNSFMTMDISGLVDEYYPHTRFGFSLSNLLSITIGDTDDRLPIGLRVGGLHRFLKDKLILSMDLDKSMRTGIGWHLGGEYWALDFASVRLGFEGEGGLRETTAGFGIKYKDYTFDYALALHQLGISNRISASWHFGPSISRSRIQEINKFYQEGMQSYQLGNYIIAMEKLNQALDIDPKNNQIRSIVDKLQIVVATLPAEVGKTKEADLTRRGIVAYMEGDLKIAVNSLRYAFSLTPENERLHHLLNKVETEAGEPLTSGTPGPKGLNLVEQKLTQALNNFYQAKYDLVIQACQDVLILEPNNVTALQRMGSAFFMLGYKDKAKETWEKALLIDPNNQEIRKALEQLK